MPIDAGSLHYAVGPGIAVLALGFLALFLRWSFAGPSSGRRPRRRPGADDGLLTPVATVGRPETAAALRGALAREGVRATTRPAGPERTQVLVFREDAARARDVVLTFEG